jgi:hypothetical protein
MIRLDTETLKSLDTLQSSHCSDLKFDDGISRIWLSRNSISDGEPFDNTVYIEKNIEGCWNVVDFYDGDNPNPQQG